jgi:hypothetical protein
MPIPDAVAAADKLRLQLLNRERAAAVRLVNAYGDVYIRLQSQIAALTAELDVMAAKGTLTATEVAKLDRFKALGRQIETEVTKYGIIAENEMNMGAREAITAGQQHARLITQAALPGLAPLDAQIMASWQSLNPGAVESLLGFLSEGSPLRDALTTRLGPAVAEQISRKLIEGIALGYNPRKVATIIRNELGQGLTWSMTTARTAQLYAYRESSRAAYLANPDIVRGWEWHSSRGGNTCMACLAMDGTKHKPNEILNDHHNGACVALPLTVTYKELGFNVEEPTPLVEHPTGESWFKAQPETVQRQMMGPGKWDAWRSGKFKFSDFPHTHDDPVYGPMRSEASLKFLLGDMAA